MQKMEIDEMKAQVSAMDREYRKLSGQGPTLEQLTADLEQLRIKESELMLKVDKLQKENVQLGERLLGFDDEKI